MLFRSDVSYCQYSTENDNLKVEVSTNCGTTWSTKYSKSGATLSTHAASTSQWTPAATTDWRHETVSLSSYAGMTSVLVRFKGTSNYGNNVYVDNINVVGVTGIAENDLLNGVNIYPNPIANAAYVDYNLTESNIVTIKIGRAHV